MTAEQGARRVLIVDDQEFMRSLIRLTLDSGRFEIVEAENGVRALELARETRPDLIFLDWSMPGLSGVEVCRRLRTDTDAAAVKIVLVTARVQEEDQRAAREAGADDYITKPFSPRQLLDKVREVLGDEALLP